MNATPLGSPVAVLFIGLGLGSICANSPSKDIPDCLSVSIIGSLSSDLVIKGKSCLNLPFTPNMKFLMGS